MTATDFAAVLRKLGLAAALICALLSLTVFAVLLIMQHEPAAQAAVRALPLMVFALFGLFGAAMTRLIGRRTH
ncbi:MULTISPECIES: hypothetical protein [unclassified Bradyrhizobium]|uniref:hypothetical protein n=1 Tax=unclassified Bradyrhizobium TaxID=2631580 RepID=UPI0024B20E24|nr:hypothetical protein [Bradyrhizobium sp. CB2312]WFU74045.1 hypothetical protein QA642_08290 [Bradyrhizobium sp. CB2312]